MDNNVRYGDVHEKIEFIENDLAGIHAVLTQLKVNAERDMVRQKIVETADHVADKSKDKCSLSSDSSIDVEHQKWVNEEYPQIYETSHKNAKKMIEVLSLKTKIPQHKFVLLQTLFTESSVKIGGIFASANDISNVDDVNAQVKQVGLWKENEIKNDLTIEEYEVYKNIDWIKYIKQFD